MVFNESMISRNVHWHLLLLPHMVKDDAHPTSGVSAESSRSAGTTLREALGFSEGHRQGTEQTGDSPELSLSPGSPFPEQLSMPAEIPPPSALSKELL